MKNEKSQPTKKELNYFYPSSFFAKEAKMKNGGWRLTTYHGHKDEMRHVFFEREGDAREAFAKINAAKHKYSA